MTDDSTFICEKCDIEVPLSHEYRYHGESLCPNCYDREKKYLDEIGAWRDEIDVEA